jgi:glycosyltransferase involved in cell wall biosynthesis
MKIVHVLPSLARGGGERLAIELANRQVASAHEVALVIGSELPAQMIHGGLDPRVKVLVVSASSGRSRYAAMLPWVWRHRSWLRSIDVLHCHLTYGALFGYAFLRMSERHNRPAIVETYHAVGMPIPAALRWFHSSLAGQWDGLAVMAEDPWWSRFTQQHEQVVARIIPAGVDLLPKVSAAAGSAYRNSLGIPENALVVTTIGRLVAERRSRSYVPIFGKIAEAMGREVHFLIVGEGPERRAIESDADRAAIRDQVHMPGLVSEIERPLAISDLYLTANVGSVPGVAGLQAVASGVPVIGIQLRENYEPRSHDCIWSNRDPDEVASKAIGLLMQPAVAADLSRRQAAYLASNHSAASMAEQYEGFYGDAIAAKAGSSRE